MRYCVEVLWWGAMVRYYGEVLCEVVGSRRGEVVWNDSPASSSIQGYFSKLS